MLAWFAGQGADQQNIIVITQAEILAEIALLPEGQHRDALAMAAHEIFEKTFKGAAWILTAKPQRLTPW